MFIQRPSCPVCASESNRELLHLDSAEIDDYLSRYYENAIPVAVKAVAHYRLWACNTCGLIWQLEILDDAGMEALYESWINADKSRSKKRAEGLVSRLGYSRQCLQAAKAARANPGEMRVLDFGMGWGNWLLMARAMGFEADGLETSTSRIQYAQKLGLNVVQPNEISPNTYHFINAEQVFEHLSDPGAVIGKCWEWLVPNGLLRIAVPNGNGIAQQIQQGRWKINAMETRPLEHINVFTTKSLRKLGTLHGFTPFAPPIVLPATGLSIGDMKRSIQQLIYELLVRSRAVQNTVLWFRKVPPN